MRSSSRLSLAVVLLSFASAALAPSATQAQTQTFWKPAGDGVWSLATNWTDGATATTSFPPPNSPGAWATFGQQTGPDTRTITTDIPVTVGRISFTSPSYTYNVNSGGITLNSGGLNRALIEKVGTASNDPDPAGVSNINSTLTIGGSANAVNLVNATSTKTLTLASLTGSGSSVTVNSYTGTGVSGTINTPSLIAVQSGSYGGAGSVTTIAAGTLQANEGTGLPTNTALVINGGTSATLWEVTQATTVTRSVGTNTGDIRVTGTVAGFSTLAGTMTLNFGGSGGTVQWGSSNFNPVTLQFGRGVSGVTDTYVLQNVLDLNGAPRTVRIAPRATVTFAGTVVNSSANPSGLNVGGASTAGTLVLTAANTYNGTTTVSGGILRAVDGVGLPTGSALVLSGGALESNGAATFSRSLGTGAGQVRLAGGTVGFSAFGGTHTIRLNGGTGTVVWGSGDFATTTTLHLNGWVTGVSNANAMVDFQNGIDLNTTSGRFLSSRDNPNSSADVGRVSGVISNSAGSGALVIGGTGVIELTAANTYTGQTLVYDSALSGATLRLSGNGSIANSSIVTVGPTQTLDVAGVTGGANFSAAANRFQVASGQTLTGTGTVSGNVFVGSGATLRGGTLPDTLNTPTGQLAVAGSLRFGSGGTLAVDLNGVSSSGATVSRVAVNGTGNTFDIASASGPMTIRLLNTGGLTAGQSYTFTVASATGGFIRDGTAVSSYAYGTDFLLAGNFTTFNGVSLTVSGSNLVLTFTPVPEPLTVGLVAAAGLALAGVARRPRAKPAQ